MPSYKLIYFDLRSRGDYIRYVFYVADQEFEDVRIPYGGLEWPVIKPKIKFGQVPILEVDGKQLAQSYTIARYLAREFGLAGKTSWELALIDQFCDLTEDMYREVLNEFYEKNEAKKKELLKHLTEVVYPKYLKMFETSLEENGGNFYVGDAVSLADIAVYTVFDTPLMQVPTLMDSYLKLKAHRKMIEGFPKLAQYVKNRKFDII